MIHVPVGKVSFSSEKITANAKALIDAVIKAKPATAKGKYVKKVNVATTMGPGILVDPMSVGAYNATLRRIKEANLRVGALLKIAMKTKGKTARHRPAERRVRRRRQRRDREFLG